MRGGILVPKGATDGMTFEFTIFNLKSSRRSLKAQVEQARELARIYSQIACALEQTIADMPELSNIETHFGSMEAFHTKYGNELQQRTG
jgi:hypothetical protein